MTYFVTGGTGFIGRNLIDQLLKRKGTVHVLVRKGSKKKFNALVKERWADDSGRVVAVSGDLTKPVLGLSKSDIESLSGKIKHFFHLAAVYDLSADDQANQAANLDGTRHALQAAEQLGAGCFHHTSSIAAAGLYQGTFREDMFEEATGLHHPYFRTKHDSEGLVRTHAKVPWRIYRPGIVVGHSKTGEIDKIDGPYYFFKLIQKMRRMLPSWVPTLGLEGGRINLVPVDFVAQAMDHIAHKPKLDGHCFHLTDPSPKRIGEVMNLFAEAAHAPLMSMRIDARLFSFIPAPVKQGLGMLPPVRRIINQVLGDLGIPKDVLSFFNYPTKFDTRETERALKGSGIEVPPLDDYAWVLWDYWERHLDPELFIDRSLSGQVRGKNVLVTGASSGIGRATALMMGQAGANVIIVARGEEALMETKAEIEAEGGKAFPYTADLSDLEDAERLVKDVLADHGVVDVLVNNAGRSIRRSIALSYDRFHDYERCMQLNYFGALKLIMGFLPAMVEQRRGQVINISSIGVLTNAPRFSAYVASKAALDSFSRCAASEFNDTGVSFTTINMPLVRTPMIAPTKIYESVPTITPEDAADMVKQAVIFRPQRIATRLGIFAQVLHAVAPKISEIVMNSAFRMFPDSAAAKGEKPGRDDQPTQEQVAFASLMRGIHW
ncbi:SDR family oxidoreductase [Wenzhouxiangella marina]|uniref:Short-chain dehydrogenase n=1 Tax=Wenzhouxiangella marina TaxID=1579979 RepID=A0A0K0XX01_9GAMM|nr:SDR family oxidoreductase [Wenzhouxiangella marina]AKS42161.1 short-chain dehydrogenase [Wenzhouxiangella marina]MBB6086067.1 NAD(P)-dependent dehydrogenase (short-subunit alcohol dehydrogenase family) [Wenzhouxiangella marina]